MTYLIKTVLLFTNKTALEKYTRTTKIPEMIISATFLVTGIALFVIIDGIKTFQIIKLVCVVASIPLAIIAFKKQKQGLALLSLLLLIGAYGLAEMSKNKPFIPKKSEVSGNSSLSKGALVFSQNCVFCHGLNGKKMYRYAPDLTASTLNEDAVIQSIREGSKGKMPAYNIIMTDENIAAVAKYVVGLHSIKTE